MRFRVISKECMASIILLKIRRTMYYIVLELGRNIHLRTLFASLASEPWSTYYGINEIVLALVKR